MKPMVFGFYHITQRAKIIVVTVMAFLFLTTGVFYVQAHNKLKPIYEVPTNKKIVALTFDISWKRNPMPVIEILKRKKLNLLFLIGALGKTISGST